MKGYTLLKHDIPCFKPKYMWLNATTRFKAATLAVHTVDHNRDRCIYCSV
jgi:hypothetical protein